MTKTQQAMTVINATLARGEIDAPQNEAERVALIRTLLQDHDITGDTDLIHGARMLADASPTPALWHAVIARTLASDPRFEHPAAHCGALVGCVERGPQQTRATNAVRFAGALLTLVTAVAFFGALLIACH